MEKTQQNSTRYFEQNASVGTSVECCSRDGKWMTRDTCEYEKYSEDEADIDIVGSDKGEGLAVQPSHPAGPGEVNGHVEIYTRGQSTGEADLQELKNLQSEECSTIRAKSATSSDSMFEAAKISIHNSELPRESNKYNIESITPLANEYMEIQSCPITEVPKHSVAKRKDYKYANEDTLSEDQCGHGNEKISSTMSVSSPITTGSSCATNNISAMDFSDRQAQSGGAQGKEKNIRTMDYSVSLDDESDDDDDPYNRFFFESDYLALKDNTHYRLLLQSLVALEGQRIQAIKDLDTLCEEEAKALDDPIRFVEKLQNKYPLGLPERQRVINLPHIPWEEYAVQLGPIEKAALSSYHHTRAATQNLEKAAYSAVQSCAAPSSDIGSSLSENTNILSKGSLLAADKGSMYAMEIDSVPFSSPFAKERESRKPASYNQPWTKEEQCRLEKLLHVYPQEEVEAKRWEKIANALENRTMKQVASRVQKYFIKLTKAGLPVPGRVPNISKLGIRTKRSTHYSTMGFRTSTFFPSYQPRVYMDEEDDVSSLCNSDEAAYISDEESVSPELRDTPEYRELIQLKSAKRQKLQHLDQMNPHMPLAHHGFMCDGCGVNPIVGARFHCHDCPSGTSVDFCSACMERDACRMHNPTHRLEPVPSNHGNPTYYVDGDYVGMSGSTSAGYNYLDPNFLPSAS